jgi:tetratricopeptide (TPR) repeat protein
MYLYIGFTEKGKDLYKEALALDGNKLDNSTSLESMEFVLGNFEEALKLDKKCSEIDTTYLGDMISYSLLSGHNNEGYLLAKKYIESAKKTGTLILQASHRIGYAFWQVGKNTQAKDYFNQQIKYDEEIIKLGRDIAQSKSAQYDLAGTFAFLGDKEKAYQYLDEFNKQKSFPLWWVTITKHDPLFNNIRNEERFQKILQNIEAKYQAEHERVKKWLEENNML